MWCREGSFAQPTGWQQIAPPAQGMAGCRPGCATGPAVFSIGTWLSLHRHMAVFSRHMAVFLQAHGCLFTGAWLSFHRHMAVFSQAHGCLFTGVCPFRHRRMAIVSRAHAGVAPPPSQRHMRGGICRLGRRESHAGEWHEERRGREEERGTWHGESVRLLLSRGARMRLI